MQPDQARKEDMHRTAEVNAPVNGCLSDAGLLWAISCPASVCDILIKFAIFNHAKLLLEQPRGTVLYQKVDEKETPE